jgi:ABC-type branched-subunit amino acid transport system substrate-binding protein
VFSACKGSSNTKTINIGMILPNTGSSAATGTNQTTAANLAVTEINKAGGVLGANLVLKYIDDQSNKANDPGAAMALINDAGVQAILGSGPSSETLAIAPFTADAGVVQISGSSTSPAISTFPSNGYLFRTAPSDAFQGKLLANQAIAKGTINNVGVIFVNSAYGIGLSSEFETAFTAGGGHVVASVEFTSGFPDAGAASMSAASTLAAVYQNDAGVSPDAILLVAAVGDGTPIIDAYNTTYQSTKNTYWFFTDSLSVQDFATGVVAGGGNFNFSHEGTAPATPSNANYTAFSTAYTTANGTAPGSFAANAYDAIYLMALGFEAAGEVNGTKLRDAIITSVTADAGTPYAAADFAKAVTALKTGPIQYQGASGNIHFSSIPGDSNDLSGAVYEIWNVADGGINVVNAAVSVN